MVKLFSIALSRNKEFSVVGVANVAKGTAKFQGLLNGVPFVQHLDYEKVREFVMKAVNMNRLEANQEAS